MNNISHLSWDEFKDVPLGDKLPFFRRNGRLVDVLFSQQFDRPFLDYIYELTNKIRIISKTRNGMDFLGNILRHKRIMLYFVQPSTRTFLSFLNACHILGIKTCEIRDTATSSEIKGESQEDSIRTFSSYVDGIVIRHFEKDFSEKAAFVLNNSNRPVPVINGGSGKDQHPTQALLDIYTLARSFEKVGGINNKTIAMVGDLKRGRTVHSLTYLMKNYSNVKLVFVSPSKFRMESDILTFLTKHSINFTETEDFESVIREADAIYMTRIQDEHDVNNESKSFYEEFSFKREHLKILSPTSVIMHPLPRRGEIDVEVDKDPRARYWRQERNGMWVRASLFTIIFGVDADIMSY